MFNTITIVEKQSNEQRLDIGFLAEAMLFYGQVNLIADKFLLPELFKIAPSWIIAEFIQTGRLKLYLKENYIGVPIIQQNGVEYFDPQTISSPSITQEALIYNGFIDSGYTEDDARRATHLIRRCSFPFKYESSVYNEIEKDLNDSDYLRNAISSILTAQNEGTEIMEGQIQANYSKAGKIGPFNANNLETNINFLNFPNSTPSGLILAIAEARGDIHIASHFNSEIASRNITAKLIQSRFNSLMSRFQNNQMEISTFQNYVFSEYKGIGEAFKNGELSVKALLKLIERSEKFRHWLSQIDDNGDFLKEYLKVVLKKGLYEKLPAKIVRFAIFKGAALASQSPLVGNALDLTDSFLVDKIVGGWKPNQFIEQVRDNLPLK